VLVSRRTTFPARVSVGRAAAGKFWRYVVLGSACLGWPRSGQKVWKGGALVSRRTTFSARVSVGRAAAGKF
jgi:hypothetical protein